VNELAQLAPKSDSKSEELESRPGLFRRLQAAVQETSDRSRSLWLLLIVLLGLSIRLTGLFWGHAYSYFGQGDGMEAYSVAVNYAAGEPKALYLGQPNYNTHSKLPGPLWTLFCFASLRFGQSIEAAILAIIFLNAAAIYLTYLVAERTVGRQCALWAALLIATLPRAVYYSVGLYNPDVMPFLSGLLLLALWQVIQRDRSRSIFWVCLVLFMMPQFHMSGLALFPTVGIILLLSSARLNFPWLAGGLLAGACLYVPYVRGEMVNGWQNTHGMFLGHEKHWWDALKVFTAPFSFLVNFSPPWTKSSAEYREFGRVCFGSFGVLLLVNVISVIAAAFIVAGAFQTIKRGTRGFWHSPRQVFRRSPGVSLLTIFFFVPLFSMLLNGTLVHTRYFLLLLPAMLSLVSSGVPGWLGSRRLGGVFLATLIVTTAADIWLMPAMYHHLGTLITKGEVFVPSFRMLKEVYQQLKQNAGANQAIQVEDSPYLKAISHKRDPKANAKLISYYVAIREKEAFLISGRRTEPVTFTLCPADELPAEDPAVAYRAHGIALVASAGSPTKP